MIQFLPILYKTLGFNGERYVPLIFILSKFCVCGSIFTSFVIDFRKESIQTKGQKGNVKCIYFDDLRIASGNGNRIRIFDFNFFDKSLIPKQEVPSSQEGIRKSSVAAGTIVMDLNAESSEVKDGTNSGKVSPHPGEVYSNRASRQSQKSTGNNRAGSTDVRKTPQKPERED